MPILIAVVAALLALIALPRSEEHTSELQSRLHLVCRLLLEKKNLRGTTVMAGLVDMHVHLVGGCDGYGVDLLGYRRDMDAFLYAGGTTVSVPVNVTCDVIHV